MRADRLQREREIAALAARQHGVVAHSQLDLGRGTVRRWVERGRLLRLYPGVFAVGHARLTQHGRWLAAVLAAGAGAVLSHRDAGAL
jgi:hypothetical protein